MRHFSIRHFRLGRWPKQLMLAALLITSVLSGCGRRKSEIKAPPLNLAGATTFEEASKFLYSGQNPQQVGVDTSIISAKRVAVLRGQVMNQKRKSLADVKICILDHPEFGSTRTRDDGLFDMAVNGGSQLTVCYENDGHCIVQRKVKVPWQQFVWLPDVVMVPLDKRVTTVDLNAKAEIQVARGSKVSDEDGNRQATLFFPQGTTAEMVLSNDSTQAVTKLRVRATEFTVGPNGPAAMPGELPANSGYTYAVEFTVDEAMKAGAKDVRFSQPLIHYVENFLNFPVGGIVPVGYYAREKAAWIPSDNGRIIKILSRHNDVADVDIDGSGRAADAAALAELGISEAERLPARSKFVARSHSPFFSVGL